MATSFCPSLIFNHSKKSVHFIWRTYEKFQEKTVREVVTVRYSLIGPRCVWTLEQLPALSPNPGCRLQFAAGSALAECMQRAVAASVQSTRWCHPVLQRLSSHSSASGCPGHCREHPVCCEKRYTLQRSRRTKWAHTAINSCLPVIKPF